MRYCSKCGVMISDQAVEDLKIRGNFCPNCKSGNYFPFIGADIQKNGITYSEGKKNFNIKATFKAIDNLSPAVFRMQKCTLEIELVRKLTDFEAEQIIAFEVQKREKIHQQFMNTKLGIPYSEGKLKNTLYPNRTNFKKRENLIMKVVKWWRK